MGKLHLEIEDTGSGRVRVTDLQSTNGTFVSVGRKWEEIKGARVVALDAELMLGDYRTTPRDLLAAAPVVAVEKAPPAPEPPKRSNTAAPRKRSGPRRNEFGEIVRE